MILAGPGRPAGRLEDSLLGRDVEVTRIGSAPGHPAHGGRRLPDRPDLTSDLAAGRPGTLAGRATPRHRRRRVHRVQLRRATGSRPTPTTPSSPTTPSPTPATGPTWPTSRTGYAFVHGDIGDLDLATRHPARARHRRGRQLRGRVAQQPGGRSTRACSSGPTCSGTQTLLEAAAQVGVGRFHHISTCEVYGDLDLVDSDEAFTEESPYRPRTPYNASKAGRRPRRAGLPRDLRAAGHDHQLRQQLRALPVPGEGHPAVHHPGPRRPAPAAVRLDRRTGGSGSTSSTTARPSSAVLADGPGGRDLPRRHRRRGQHRARSPTGCSTPSGKPASLKTIVPDRPGHDRRYLLDASQDPAASWAGSRPSTSTRAWPTRSRWYADNRAWWEPLRDRAPVVESAWQAGSTYGRRATPAVAASRRR